MINTVYTQAYQPNKADIREILRYAGVSGQAPELEGIIRDCLCEAERELVYRVCYREFSVRMCDDGLDLGFLVTPSADLKKNLSGCERLILFGATVGVGLDRLIARYSAISPTKALILQAIGAERIESLCDAFCADVALKMDAEGYKTNPRFSAGYGDFPISAQKEIFAVLDLPRKIGLTLNESMIMSPSKSVTAIIGISKKLEN